MNHRWVSWPYVRFFRPKPPLICRHGATERRLKLFNLDTFEHFGRTKVSHYHLYNHINKSYVFIFKGFSRMRQKQYFAIFRHFKQFFVWSKWWRNLPHQRPTFDAANNVFHCLYVNKKHIIINLIKSRTQKYMPCYPRWCMM